MAMARWGGWEVGGGGGQGGWGVGGVGGGGGGGVNCHLFRNDQGVFILLFAERI